MQIKDNVDYTFVIIKKFDAIERELLGIGSFVTKIKSNVKLFKQISTYPIINHRMKDCKNKSLYFCSNLSAYLAFIFKFKMLFKKKNFNLQKIINISPHLFFKFEKIYKVLSKLFHILLHNNCSKINIFYLYICNKICKLLNWSNSNYKAYAFSTLIYSTLYLYLQYSKKSCPGFSIMIKFRNYPCYKILDFNIIFKEIHINNFNLLYKYDLVKIIYS
mmetsp:Transcript_10061/g.13860  ORF Transcript_10061/g.13860 Transcript_10061/m.13860 type:complete len:218 (-) Transcript_10061:731-1384(-)